jgi:hypothetical protein
MVKVHYDEGVANRVDPRAVRACPRGQVRSVGRGAHRPAIEPRKVMIPDADAVVTAEGKTGEARFRERPPVRRGRRPWHVRKPSVFREPGDLVFGRAALPPRRSVSGRRGAVADDERTREVTLRHSSCEADEQNGAIRHGAGGAKGGDQGERETGRHAPDSEPGRRVRNVSTTMRHRVWLFRLGFQAWIWGN